MRQDRRISNRLLATGLSVFALGLLASGSRAFAEDPAEVVAPAIESRVDGENRVDGQVDNLRNLFEAASRNGLLQMRDDMAPASADSEAGSAERLLGPALDCTRLAPLTGGGRDGFATGLFAERATDDPDTAGLARTLADLIDPSYDGRLLEPDLRTAGDCGPSFLPWQVLADPGRDIGAGGEADLTAALALMNPLLRRPLGVQIAIRANLSGNARLMRRVSDTLIDGGLHGRAHHDRDPDHVLLDAMLLRSRDPVGARARLAWLAERDGPEQMTALDLMRTLDAAPAARSELKRLSDSPDAGVRLSAQQRLLATAIEEADIELVAEMVTSQNNLSEDDLSRERLAARLEEAIETGDPLTIVQALDVIDRLEAKGVRFTPELKAKVAARIARLSEDVAVAQADFAAASLPVSARPDRLSGPELNDYLGTLSDDMDAYREVLSRG
ncbi:hypothetical protein [uncultured Algimonas sp.]|uniref:hypothetical protein n=1 Tax=uncultured Algimonas sp. TaxID=1547920 RepID=UPI00260DDC20|nr:hypothetical protein [uncultured Algimonas sp.]